MFTRPGTRGRIKREGEGQREEGGRAGGQVYKYNSDENNNSRVEMSTQVGLDRELILRGNEAGQGRMAIEENLRYGAMDTSPRDKDLGAYVPSGLARCGERVFWPKHVSIEAQAYTCTLDDDLLQSSSH